MADDAEEGAAAAGAGEPPAPAEAPATVGAAVADDSDPAASTAADFPSPLQQLLLLERG